MRIFISHGTDKSVPQELDFLDTLAARLTVSPPGHEILLDRSRIEAGDDWEGVLYDFVADCQAAVLLLGPRALERPWVWKESNLLSYRKAREATFPFFLVLLPGVTEQDVSQHWALGALNLTATQAFPADTAADAVADWVLLQAQLAQPAVTTPLDQLERALEAHLAKAHAPGLEMLCEQLLGEPVPWVASERSSQQRTRALARGIARGRLKQVGGLAELTKRLYDVGLVGEPLEAVRKLAASMWVDAELAGSFAALMARPADTEPFAAALNGRSFDWAAKMVAWRALLPDTREFIYRIEGGNSDDREGEIIARMRSAYRNQRKDLIYEDAQVDDLLRVRRQPIVYVLPPPLPDDALMRSLRARYPRVTFIAHTGRELPPQSELPTTVLRLSPGMDLDVELVHWSDYTTAEETK